MELDWNRPLVRALQATKIRTRVNFQTCLKVEIKLRFLLKIWF
jgi:hypothetical protein